MENHARYGENIYALADETVLVNLFIASTLGWKKGGVTITQETRFPDADTTRLTVRCKSADGVALAFRHPGWCQKPVVRINGKRVKAMTNPKDRYCWLETKARDGDVVEIQLPMKLALVPLPNDSRYAALMYGPIVLAARLGTHGLTTGSQLIVNERQSGEMLDEKVEIPRWTKPVARLLSKTKRTPDDELTFVTAGFEGGKDLQMIPWFRLTNERHNLYWHQS
jgi:uncharacterized protein